MNELLQFIRSGEAASPVLFLAIVLGTFILEDLTCVVVGMLMVKGQMSPLLGTVAAFTGIFLGDLGLWALGKTFGKRVLAWRPVRRRLSVKYMESMGSWFDRHAAGAILATRFIPGTRFAVYVSYGIFGRRPLLFVVWTFIACLIWTPLIIAVSAGVVPAVIHPVERLLGKSWLSLGVGAALLVLLLRTVAMMWTAEGRARILARVSLLWRWEFWPVWLFYLPLVPWVGRLCLRYGGFTVFTAANPSIPEGGVVGESKYAILTKLPSDKIIPTRYLGGGNPRWRAEAVARIMDGEGWTFPLVIKPDASQRAAGFKVVKSHEEVERYFEAVAAPVVVQVFHPGPFEAGVFYYRIPSEERGRLFSVTDKRFSMLRGDGRSTFRRLIWSHPRYRMQAKVFLERHRDILDKVLEDGEEIMLAVAGNHCQGTLFKDGSHLITPALERSIDRIARTFDGFYFGRFDVRYSDEEAFMAGEGFGVIELNGVTSEATGIYDPDRSLFSAYRTLFRQWELCFRIGAENIARGHRPTPVFALLRSIRAYYRDRSFGTLSD